MIFAYNIKLRHASNPKMSSPQYDAWQKFLDLCIPVRGGQMDHPRRG